VIVNPARIARDVVVVAASAGGLRPLRTLCAALSPDLRGSIFIVWHRSPFVDGQILPILRQASRVPVIEPAEGQPFEKGAVYLAPRDRHLVLADGAFHLSRGPKQHFLRPAADALFTSAALSQGQRVLGVVLSGSGFDGALGAVDIKARGGVVLTQAPDDADVPFMPRNTLAVDHVDASLPLSRLPEAIAALVAGEAIEVPPPPHSPCP
jgi:two-component system chemotaxis response regulator CheB